MQLAGKQEIKRHTGAFAHVSVLEDVEKEEASSDSYYSDDEYDSKSS